MPYIPQHLRAEARRRYAENRTVDDAGAAAFLIADVIECFLPEKAAGYAERAFIIGIAHTTVEESRRRLLDHYEDSKRHQNGDVYSKHE